MFNIIDFGAKADGKTLNSAAFEQAIAACVRNGGGTVRIPAGTFLTGTIYLKSHVELRLEHGAVIKASSNINDYNPDNAYPQNFECPREEWRAKHLIIAHEVEDAAITGSGTIDGSGSAFFEDHGRFMPWSSWRDGLRLSKNKETLRPGQLIVFIESKDILVKDIRIRNSPCWSIFFHGCENVRVHGISIQNGRGDANTDGIDIDCCRNVTVSNCVIDTGDDAIALRGASHRLKNPRPCENVTISNCVLAASSAGIRIGVGTGTIRHVEIGNLVFSRSGIGVIIQSSYNKFPDGVDISNIQIHHSRFCGSGGPFSIFPGNDQMSARIRDISFDNCFFEFFHSGVILNSGPIRVNNIAFRDCEFSVVPNTIPDRLETPENAIDIHGADNIEFRNCRLLWNSGDPAWKNAFFSADTTGLKITDCSFPPPPTQKNKSREIFHETIYVESVPEIGRFDSDSDHDKGL